MPARRSRHRWPRPDALAVANSLVLTGVLFVGALTGIPASSSSRTAPDLLRFGPDGVSVASAAHTAATPLTWTELLPEGGPPTNSSESAVLVYDPVASETIDFAASGYRGLSSVWSFDGGRWSNITPSGNLTQQDLIEYSATFDAAAGAVLLFGESDAFPYGNETWEYAAGSWSELDPTTSPAGTPMAGVTYDPTISAAILVTTVFGQASALTWEFQGGNWTRLSTATALPAFTEATMAFDNTSVNPELVLFADGFQAGASSQGFQNQTWVFSSNDWSNVTAASGPAPPADEGAMAYDASIGALVLADAGYFANSSPALTWVFANGSWSYLPVPSVPPSIGSGEENLVFDPAVGYTLLVIDGLSGYTGNFTTETWMLNRTSIGPPPTVALSVAPINLTVGSSFRVIATAVGGYGAVGLRLIAYVPGCMWTNRTVEVSITEICTPTAVGESPFFGASVSDQAGRGVYTFQYVGITAPPSTWRWSFVAELLIGSVGAAGVVLFAIIVVVRRQAARSDRGSGTGPGAVGPRQPS